MDIDQGNEVLKTSTGALGILYVMGVSPYFLIFYMIIN